MFHIRKTMKVLKNALQNAYKVFGCTKYRILKSSQQTAKVAKTDTNSIVS